MTSKLWLPLLSASSLSLAGCGGGNPQPAPVASRSEVAIGGTITGLPTGSTLILTNGTTETVAINASGNYQFAKKIPSGADYNISIFGNSSGLACTLSNGTGKADPTIGNVSNINIACVPGAIALINIYVGITVSGLLAGNSVTLTNNGKDTLIANDNGFFVFRNYYVKEAIYSGQVGGYSVAIQTNPQGQLCSVSNASGSLPLGQPLDFVNIPVVCK